MLKNLFKNYPPHLSIVGDFIAAASIFVVPYLFVWGYYLVTGEYLDFGGAQ